MVSLQVHTVKCFSLFEPRSNPQETVIYWRMFNEFCFKPNIRMLYFHFFSESQVCVSVILNEYFKEILNNLMPKKQNVLYFTFELHINPRDTSFLLAYFYPPDTVM